MGHIGHIWVISLQLMYNFFVSPRVALKTHPPATCFTFNFVVSLLLITNSQAGFFNDVRLLRLITNQNNVTDWRHIHQISQPEAAALTLKYEQSFLAIISMSKRRVHFRKKSFYWNLFLYIKGTCLTIAHMKNWFEVLPWNGLVYKHIRAISQQ